VSAWWSAGDRRLTVRLRVTPNGRRSEVLDTTGDRLRLRLAAPAVDGKANDELARFLAELFGVRRSAVSIVAGQRAREKTVAIEGVQGPPDALR
jgi:uncharacterized protein (TIGR00251 family)